jgi:hypothetical protein
MIYTLSGGGTGGTLVVTGVAGDTVTATKDGKSYKRTFNASGIATFKGLKTGTWAITMTDGSQSVTQNVTINADYTLTMAYFSALITTTWPEGSTCSCTDGTSTLYAPDTSGSYTFNVPNKGTWTVTATNGDKTASKSVSITAEGQTESVTLAYEYVLYEAGTKYAELTDKSSTSATYGGKATLTWNADSATFYFGGSTSFTSQSAWTYSPQIDLSAYKKLCCTLSSLSLSKSSASSFVIAVSSAASPTLRVNGTVDNSLALASATTNGTIELDISAIENTNGTVLVGLRGNDFDSTPDSGTAVMTKLWLE